MTKKTSLLLFVIAAVIVGVLSYYQHQPKEEVNSDQILHQEIVSEDNLSPQQIQISASTSSSVSIIAKSTPETTTSQKTNTNIFILGQVKTEVKETRQNPTERLFKVSIVDVRSGNVNKGSEIVISNLSCGFNPDPNGLYIIHADFVSKNGWYDCTSVSKLQVDRQYAADFSDDAVLMGASHNVFIGRVVEQFGIKDLGIGPEIQFRVAVIDNIKGFLKGVIIIDQETGGTESLNITPGSTYLFATRYNPTEDWYTLNSYPTASKLLSTDAGAQNSSLKALAEADLRVQQLRDAYSREVLIDADIAHNNTRNSFESVQAAKTQ